MTFDNQSGLEFTDISSELWRRYTFPGGDKVYLSEPLRLHVSEHGHRVFTANGESHYIPFGWIHLQWRAKEGSPHFVK